MIPSRRLVLLVAFLSVPLLLSGLNRTTADVALLANLLLLGVALLDLLISPALEDVEIERRISDVLSLGGGESGGSAGAECFSPSAVD